MHKPNDLTNQTFGRLTAIELVKNNKKGGYWLCKCQCGKTTIVRNDKLLYGTTKSCGCLAREMIIARNTKRALGLSRTNIYRRYWCMINRCYCKGISRVKKHYYQDRNIKVCDEWLGENGFINFYNWAVNNGYKKELTIDRIDNDKGYSPDNCRWVDYKTQNKNKRKPNRDGTWKRLHELDLQDRKER